jgi:hypothetical protein
MPSKRSQAEPFMAEELAACFAALNAHCHESQCRRPKPRTCYAELFATAVCRTRKIKPLDVLNALKMTAPALCPNSWVSQTTPRYDANFWWIDTERPSRMILIFNAIQHIGSVSHEKMTPLREKIRVG